MVSLVPHASKRVLHFDFTNYFAGMSLDILEELSLCWDCFFQRGLEVWFRGRGISSYRGCSGRQESRLSQREICLGYDGRFTCRRRAALGAALVESIAPLGAPKAGRWLRVTLG